MASSDRAFLSRECWSGEVDVVEVGGGLGILCTNRCENGWRVRGRRGYGRRGEGERILGARRIVARYFKAILDDMVEDMLNISYRCTTVYVVHLY